MVNLAMSDRLLTEIGRSGETAFDPLKNVVSEFNGTIRPENRRLT